MINLHVSKNLESVWAWVSRLSAVLFVHYTFECKSWRLLLRIYSRVDSLPKIITDYGLDLITDWRDESIARTWVFLVSARSSRCYCVAFAKKNYSNYFSCFSYFFAQKTLILDVSESYSKNKVFFSTFFLLFSVFNRHERLFTRLIQQTVQNEVNEWTTRASLFRWERMKSRSEKNYSWRHGCERERNLFEWKNNFERERKISKASLSLSQFHVDLQSKVFAELFCQEVELQACNMMKKYGMQIFADLILCVIRIMLDAEWKAVKLWNLFAHLIVDGFEVHLSDAFRKSKHLKEFACSLGFSICFHVLLFFNNGTLKSPQQLDCIDFPKVFWGEVCRQSLLGVQRP